MYLVTVTTSALACAGKATQAAQKADKEIGSFSKDEINDLVKESLKVIISCAPCRTVHTMALMRKLVWWSEVWCIRGVEAPGCREAW